MSRKIGLRISKQPINLLPMLRLTVCFLAIALMSSVFGYGGIDSGAALAGRVSFFAFLALSVVSLTLGNGISKRSKQK